ncbi:MAG: membrane protein insertase YidC [Propionibacteriaceae bacterium]
MIPLGIWSGISHFFSLLMQPLYTAVSALIVFFHWLVSFVLPSGSGWTWAISIILLTVLIRTLMIPLFVKSIRSSRNMQLIQPKIQALQKKYAGDRERLGQETMKLYKEEGINPMSSCLPMLIQLPIFWALYTVLYGASKGRPAGLYLRNRTDLVNSLRDANIFGSKLSGSFLPLQNFGATQINALILIIIMTGLMFYMQLQMTRKNMPPEALSGPMAQQQKFMLYLLPAIYAIGGVNIPIGVLIYWTFSNMWTVAQQGIMIRLSPTPNTPAYLDWEERMRAKGLDPRQIERERAAKRNKTVVATADPTTGVARQKVARQRGKITVDRNANTVTEGDDTSLITSDDASVGDSDDSLISSSDKTKIQRQQPARTARAVRKKK